MTHDSREARPDGIYVAVRGARVDGRRFTRGLQVAAVICDGPVEVRCIALSYGDAAVQSSSTARDAPNLWASLHGH